MSAKQMIELTINGEPVEARLGQTVYEVVAEQSLDQIPTLCHAKELTPYGSCFVCVVEVEGRPNLVPSCSTKVAPGMVVTTRNDRIIQSRKTALELLMSNHYADCLAPCVLGCPAHVDVQGYIALAARGQFREAADLIRRTNPLPAVCGRVCVRKCEEVCRRLLVDSPVAINDMKRYITDSPDAYEGGPEREAATGKRVAIVGGGPAGLTAAYYLGLRGHECKIFEMMPEAGGMLRYGIPSYRLPRDVLAKEIDYICSRSGATIEYNTKLGVDFQLAGLREDYDAVYLALGAMAANDMRVPGEAETAGVLKGLDFLIEVAQDETKTLDGTVVVVGGGNTAMDAARTAKRIGADKVIVIYRRMREQMPADPMEIEASREEGISLIELAAPQELVTDSAGQLQGIKCIRMELGEPDDSGRRRPVPVEGSEFVQNCDWCISAIGQSPVLDGIDPKDEANMPETTRWNTLVADGLTYATRVPGVFTGGDVETGPSVAIDCIAAGQRVSRSIHAYLAGDLAGVDLEMEAHMAHFNQHTAPKVDFKKAIVMRKELLSEVSAGHLGHQPKVSRQRLPEIEVEDREGNFAEVATGFTWDEAHHEWPRCLSCGCMEVDDCRLREYCSEYGVNLVKYAGGVRKYQPDTSHPYIIIDNNKCILCTKCIRTCEQVLGESALSLVNRGFGAMVQPAMGKTLAETPCVSCGSCVSTCPTGALTVKYPFPGRAVVPATVTETTCGFCSLGCTATVKQAGPGRFWIEPPADTSKRLCRFGRFGNELYIDQERITTPLKRESGQFKPTSFEDAYADIVNDMKQNVNRYGPESVAVFVSPELTNEMMFMAQKIAREALGTNNISSLSGLLVESTPNTLTPMFGFTASTADRRVLEEADLIVLNNCDLKLEQLILAMKVIESLNRGAKVIAAAGVHGDLIQLGTLNLEPLRGSSTMMWEGVAKQLLEGGFDRSRIQAMPGGDDFLNSVDAADLDNVLKQSGVDSGKLNKCSELLSAAEHVVFIHSPDRTEDKAPGDITMLGNIMALLHSQGKRTDLLLPRAACNTAGLETCGAAVEFMPGRQAVPDELRHVTPIRDTLLKRVVNGEIRAALIIGEDPFRNEKLRGYLGNLRFLAVMAETMSETAFAADVVLPATNYLEEDGTRVNFEGRIHHFQAVMPAPSGRQSWRVLCGLAGTFRLIGLCDSKEELHKKLQMAVKAGYGEYTPFYWNTGEQRQWRGPKGFQQVQVKAAAYSITHYLTMIQRYKYDAEVIGINYFRMPQGMAGSRR